MLKTFRNLRIKLIVQENVRKYLLYAIGEIMLVVIGILIALQINSWNTQRLDNIEASKIRSSIHNEFKQNKLLLDNARTSNMHAFNANMTLLNLMGETKVEIEKHNIDSLINFSLAGQFYFPMNNSIESVFQTGRFDLIQDDSTKIAILDWYSALELFNGYQDLQTNFQQNHY